MKYFLLVLAFCAFAVPASAQDFRTDPSCWTSPRIYHSGTPSTDIVRRIERTPNVTREPRDTSVVSPNGAYKAWVEIPNTPIGIIADLVLYIYSEQGRVTRFYIEQARMPLTPIWVNEKLVFVRVVWGRSVFTDMMIDAESGDILYQEEARAGQNAFEQYKQVCGNTCPCDPSVLTSVAPPVSVPAEGEVIGHLELNTVLNHVADADSYNNTAKAPLSVYVDVAGDKVEITKISDADALQTDGNDEWESALVYDRESGWFQIGLVGKGQRKGWVKETDAQSFISMPDQLRASLAYLDEDWDGRIWAAPSGDGGYTISSLHTPAAEHPEYAAEIINIRNTETGPWLKVTIHRGNDCTRDKSTIVDEGWVPAWSSDGKLVGGYYPRGC